MDINTCFATTFDVRTLALYANIVPALTSIILAGFVLRSAVDRSKVYMFAGFVGVFSLWLLANSVLWTSNDYYLVAGLWTPLAYVELLFFLLLFCFFYLDVFSVIPRWLSALVLVTTAVSFVINVLGGASAGFDQAWCNMYNSEFLNNYNLGVEIVILLAILGLGTYRVLKLKEKKDEQIRLTMITSSIVLFMGIFSGSEYVSANSTVYLAELYALFFLPIFILFLTVAITTYGTFRLGDTVAKALFYIFLVFSGAQFFFVSSLASAVLTTIAFLMTLSFGILLLRSYEREARIRAQVEQLAGELAKTNERQETLIHFIGHEVKNSLTKDAGAFAAIAQGDFGAPPDGMKPFVEHALAESRQSAGSVENILKAANLKKGTVAYAKAPFELKALVSEAVEKARPMAMEKRLALSFLEGDSGSPYIFNGDKSQISDHVLRNLIENSINYTPSGSVTVSLKKEGNKFVFAVKDTGIGISEEDKKRLFTEGGHGKDSQKINVHSTGYGLYIAKSIVEAHGGAIGVESEGQSKGSLFVVELPVS